MAVFDSNQDYATPYHWYMSPSDMCYGGLEYWQYIVIAEELFRSLPKKTILEIGCGDGRISDYIAGKYPESNVLGIDISPKAIAFATLMGIKAEYRCVDAVDITDKYDVVLLIKFWSIYR